MDCEITSAPNDGVQIKHVGLSHLYHLHRLIHGPYHDLLACLLTLLPKSAIVMSKLTPLRRV